MKVYSTISLPLPLPSFKALLSHIAYRKFQSYLSTASSQSGALPRAAGDVSDLIALLLGKPTAKKRHIQHTNIQHFIATERENNWKNSYFNKKGNKILSVL